MRGQVLRGPEREALAERDEQLAVRTEHKPRAEMVAADDLRILPEDHLHIVEAVSAELAARHRGAGFAVVARLRIGEIDEAVLAELWIER